MVEDADKVLFEGDYKQDVMDVIIHATCNALSVNLHIYEKMDDEAVLLPTCAT